MTQTDPNDRDHDSAQQLETTAQRRTTYIWVIVIAVTVIALDQLSKSWAVASLSDGSVVELVWTLQFKLAFNTGMAFSAGSGSGKFIGAGAILIVAVLMWLAKDVHSTLHRVLIGVVAGGALGNVVDRLFRDPKGGSGFMSGAVVDFIDLQWWPIFNIADAAIVVGGICLAITGLAWAEGKDETTLDTLDADVEPPRVALPGEFSDDSPSASPRD